MGTRERRERSNESDRSLLSLFYSAAQEFLEVKGEKGVALAAVGGYGRGELAPGSDLDILILHQGQFSKEKLAAFVNALLYPLWDKYSVDHSVRTQSETGKASTSDLRVALGLLDIRLIAGDPNMVAGVLYENLKTWQRNSRARLPELKTSMAIRHDRAGELAYLLEPDLKEARGGLRDINALRAIALSGSVPVPLERISWAESTLNNAREALHTVTGRNKDRLLFQEQDKVAAALGYSDADAMMSEVAKAARLVDYLLEYTWHLLDHKGRDGLGRYLRKPRTVSVAKNISVSNNEIVIDPLISFSEDPVIGLRTAATAAQLGLPIALETCALITQSLINGTGTLPTPWPREARENLISLIGAGESMVRIFESLDQEEIIFGWIPEWRPLRSLAQRNALHHHTVDRHMVETAVQAAKLTRKVHRPDLLLFAALFHDIGKGGIEDHSVRGERLIAPLAARIGFESADVTVLQILIRHHLLLSATATRRDLDDPATIASIIDVIPDLNTLELLHALSVADGEATGSTGWSDWKASLVSDLVHRVRSAMSGSMIAEQPALTQEQLVMAQTGVLTVNLEPHTSGYSIEIVSPDKPGLLSLVAGVLNTARLDVKSARTKSHGKSAVMYWIVTPEPHAPEMTQVKLRNEIVKAFEDSTLVEEKLIARAKAYSTIPSIPVPPPEVVYFNNAATDATVIEVRSHDRPGLLFRIGSAITQSKVDINSAIVTTLGAEAIDTLYVTELGGGALSNARAEEVTAKLRLALK
ncbi:MAG: [protein-PII] uridylyltransferase [Actinobacteria bacterium]|jgi:[protein-PII] uridylyltransferase|nr:[protein-PII] uridylyltransferase [Actinomycetota bacterium]